jgi:hypothetical protein
MRRFTPLHRASQYDLSAAALGSGIRATVAALDRSVAVSSVRSMESQVADSVAPFRFNVVLLGLFAAIAPVLAAKGLYGIFLPGEPAGGGDRNPNGAGREPR